MRNLNDIKDRRVLVVGAGATIKTYKKQIDEFIKSENCLTIGINNVTHLFVPDFHLWTNERRFREFGSCINPSSTVVIKKKFNKDVLRKHWRGEYLSVDYASHEKYFYKDGVIYGNFRMAGVLAVMIAHIYEASDISVVGMDGLTLYSSNELESKDGNQHCYGKGLSDDASYEDCLKKDNMVQNELSAMAQSGIKFNIITPTKFIDFYNKNALSN